MTLLAYAWLTVATLLPLGKPVSLAVETTAVNVVITNLPSKAVVQNEVIQIF